MRKDGELLDILLASQMLGHSALIGQKHTATVLAAVESHVLCFNAAELLTLGQHHFPFILAVLADRCALVSKLNQTIASGKKPLDDRLWHHLSWLSRGKKGIWIDITHNQLADLTGSTYWSISRALKEMERTGAIHRGYRRIHIIDMELARKKSDATTDCLSPT